jgi:hypothetical protein
MIINGERISGGINGPEAMLGTLVRVILDQVQRMRERYLEIVPASYPKRKLTTFSDLDESQALSCARDILLSCNRTESGGDTYLAIESLLVKKDFAVLTPLGSEEEPLEIIVDIVESKHRVLPHRENSPHDDINQQDFDHVYSSEMQTHSILSLSKRITDDYTDSSGLTFSVSTHEDDPQHVPRADPTRQSQYRESEHLGISYLESGDLSMPSDIEGATAIKSSSIHSKSTKRRTKDMPKLKFQGSGSVSDSSNYSDHSANIEDSFIPDTSHEETSESAEDFDRLMSNSYDSSDSPPLGKSCGRLSPLTRMIEDEDLVKRFHENSPQPSLPTSLVVHSPHYGNSDDVTLDLSEVTLDSALKSNGVGPFSKAIKFVSSTPSKSRSDKGLLSQILKRNEGRSKVVEEGETKSRSVKKQTTLGGIRQALRHKSSSKSEIEVIQDTNPAAQSMCIRIQMIAKSKYRLCNLDPQNELEDNWAVVHGGFHQVFFLKSHSNGRPSMSDRLVTIQVVSAK